MDRHYRSSVGQAGVIEMSLVNFFSPSSWNCLRHHQNFIHLFNLSLGWPCLLENSLSRFEDALLDPLSLLGCANLPLLSFYRFVGLGTGDRFQTVRDARDLWLKQAVDEVEASLTHGLLAIRALKHILIKLAMVFLVQLAKLIFQSF